MDIGRPDYRSFLTIEDYLLQEDLGAFRLPRAATLVGKSFALHEDGRETPRRIEFTDRTTLSWDEGERVLHDVMEIRPDIYFVDWLNPGAPNESTSVVLDLHAREATLIHCRLPKSAEEASMDFAHRIREYNDLSSAKASIRHAGIGQPRKTPRHGPTKDLVGKRVIHHVGDQHQYEHIYLNQHAMAWQSHVGPDKSLGEVNPCHHVKLGDDLYLVILRAVFTREIVVLVTDFVSKRSLGKIFFASTRDHERRWNHPVGTRLQLLGTLAYD